MGQKTHPIGFRIGISKTWSSRWFTKKNYAQHLHEDLKLNRYLKKKLYSAGISKINIERAANKIKVNVYSSRPGLIIGKKGSGVEGLQDEIQKFTKDDLVLNILEIRKPEIDATLVAESISDQLQRRVAFRRAMKKAMSTAQKIGVKGIKIKVAGRLGGTDIARTEGYAEGSVPLHTLQANIDYGVATAKTTYGQIGIKVWIHKGEVPANERKQGSSTVLDLN